VGHAAALQFSAAKVNHVILDQAFDTNHLEDDHLFIEGDATHEQLLLDAGIKKARGLLALLGSDPENVFLVLSARELNPTLRIIARANEPHVENKLLKAGADTVISPFTTAGIQVANDMLAATTGRGPVSPCCLSSAATPRWVTIEAPNPLVGCTVAAAASEMGGAILGLRRGGVDRLQPGDDTRLEAGDELLVTADVNFISEHRDLSMNVEPSIVIVDDNPVIVKLYTRLFQKAGFTPHTAADGATGLELIKRIKPQAAVIDFQLPIMSGIEICTHLRGDAALTATRLILFTADDNAATRELALAAGADAVVVKSPEAREVIETVVRIIST
jgi:voltage-gated potassium channel